MRVRVHRKDCRKGTGWAIRDLNLEQVDWSSDLFLTNCKLYVDQSGRRSIIEGTNERLLHAWVEGDWNEDKLQRNVRQMRELRYNPYSTPYFVYKDTNEPVFELQEVYFNNRSLFTPF